MSNISKFLNDESGATAAEYGLILALVAAVIIAAFTTLGTSISGKVSNVATQINAAS
jgi:pilus assembly protein Flp/PilA